MRNDSAISSGHSACTLSGPPGCSRIARSCAWPNAISAARSPSDNGCRLRNVSATVSSPAAISICAISRFAHRASRSASPSAARRSPTSGSSVWQIERSATKRGLISRKPDQHLVLLGDPLDRQAALAAIAPGLVGQRIEPALGRDLADALEVLGQHALLRRDLRGRLAGAAGCSRCRCRSGRNAARRDRASASAAPRPSLRRNWRLRLVSGCARARPAARRDEHGLAVDARDAAAVVGQVGDVDFGNLHG